MELFFTNGKRIDAGTMFCVARNYTAHAGEMNSTVPDEPSIFIKPPQAYISDGDTILLPEMSANVHHEVELVVVIGKESRGVTKDNAHEIIAGYAVGIDVTMRDIQKKAKDGGMPWAVAKGFATSAPVSQVIPAGYFKDEIPEFTLQLKINDELRQSGSTADMVRSVPELLEFVSNVFWLKPGDCIFTGTPEGVGKINKGDVLTAELVGYISMQVTAE